MKYLRNSLSSAFLTILTGCAALGTAPIKVGEPEQTIIAKLGNPTHRYQDGQDHLLEYAHGPWGQQTYMARISADGKLISYEQVLTAQKFAFIKINEFTKGDVLRMIGAPSETTYLTLSQLGVWSYPYKENGTWDSMMHVHFDHAGIVRKMLNGPDPHRDPDERFPFSMMRMK